MRRLQAVIVVICLAAISGSGQAQKAPTVREIQSKLQESGLQVGTPDGVWGKKSRAALRAFQAAKGLQVTGVADPATIQALFPPKPPPEPRATTRDRPTVQPPEPKALAAEPSSPPAAAPTPAPAKPTETSRKATTPVEQVPHVSTPRLEHPAATSSGVNIVIWAGFAFLVIFGAWIARSIVGRKTHAVVDRSSVVAGGAKEEGYKAAGSDVALVSDRGYEIAEAVASIPPEAILGDGAASPRDPKEQSRNETAVTADADDPAHQPIGPALEAASPEMSSDPLSLSPSPVVTVEQAEPEVSITAVPSPAVDLSFMKLDQRLRISERAKSAVATIVSSPPVIAGTPIASAPSPRKQAPPIERTDPWTPQGVAAWAWGKEIPGGLIYVGTNLSPQIGVENDNCLINPRLPIGTQPDRDGREMGYWPSYSTLAPNSRRAYVDWLCSDRSNPQTYIGYVFLYFYGLERRLLLDRSEADRGSIIDEVVRLLRVYGENYSFRRYATALLAAADLAFGVTGEAELEFEPSGGELPLTTRLVLGRSALSGDPISPELFLAWVMGHPETRVRMPARRSFDLVSSLFKEKMVRTFPDGLRLTKLGRLPALDLNYQAASASFRVPILDQQKRIPDLSGVRAPLERGRQLLDECTEELSAYSRDVGRRGGSSPTLCSLAKLPPALRRRAADELPGRPLDELQAAALATGLVSSARVQALLGYDAVDIGKGRLRDMVGVLGTFDIGVSPDPAFGHRVSRETSEIALFELGGHEKRVSEPTDGYRFAYLEIALGLVIAFADEDISEPERLALESLIAKSDDVLPNERARLKGDMTWLMGNMNALNDLKARVKTAPPVIRKRLAAGMVDIALSDGVASGPEVTLLERLYRQLDIEVAELYGQLQRAGVGATRDARIDDDLPTVIHSTPSTGTPIPSEPRPEKKAVGFDAKRLATIRAETLGVTTILSEIFAEEAQASEASAPPIEMPADPDEKLDGLDGRHRALIAALLDRESWSQDEFEHLAKDMGLMPGAALEAANSWSLDTHDELLIEQDGTEFMVNQTLAIA